MPNEAIATAEKNGAAATEATTAEALAYQFSGIREQAVQQEQTNLNAPGAGENEAPPAAASASTNLPAEGQTAEGSETPAAAEEAGAGASAGAAEGDEVPDGTLPPELQARIDKRIGKEVGKRKALEEELAKVKAELAQKGNNPPSPQPSPPGEGEELTPSKSEAKAGSAYQSRLERELAVAEANLRWARRNANGGTAKDGQGNDVEFSAEQAMQIELKATEDIGRLGFKLEQFQEQAKHSRAVLSQSARTQYPDLYVKGSEANQLAQRFLSEFPQLLEIPGGDLALGDIVSRTLERIEKAKGTPAAARQVLPAPVPPAPKPTPMPRGGSVAPGARVPAAANGRQPAADFSKAGTVADLAASFARQRAA